MVLRVAGMALVAAAVLMVVRAGLSNLKITDFNVGMNRLGAPATLPIAALVCEGNSR